MKRLDVAIRTVLKTCPSLLSFLWVPHLHPITWAICSYFVIRMSALHFYSMEGIYGYSRQDEDQARTDPSNLIHLCYYGIGSLPMGCWAASWEKMMFQRGREPHELSSQVGYGLQTVRTPWVISPHWDVSLLQSEGIDLFGHSVASFPHYFLDLQMLLCMASIMPYWWHYCLSFWDPIPA